LWAESDTLLKANLAKSHSPYYLMSQLGSNARKLGRVDEALRWYAQAFDKSEGPATRLQWGSGYLSALVDLAPQDAARIEKTAGQLLAEAARDNGAFEGRSVRSLQRMSGKLLSWSGDKAPQRAVMRRLQAQLDGICPKVDAADGQRAACQACSNPPRRQEDFMTDTNRWTRRAGAWPCRCWARRCATRAAISGPAERRTAVPTDTFTGRWVHAFAAYGPPKYGPDFKHFDYVNPQAPKGGTLRLKNPDRRSSFDKYNPWTTRGNAPAGVLIWMVESLGHLAQDEPMTVYGLLAEAINVAPDFGSVSFRLRPQARFNNGDPVTAEDVRHSWAMLASPGAPPSYQTAGGGHRRRGGAGRAHGALRVSRQDPRAGLRGRHDAGVFAQVGRGQDLRSVVTSCPSPAGPT
jgi:hypothetical protein